MVVPKPAVGAGLAVLRLTAAAGYRRILARHRPSTTNPLLSIVVDVLRISCQVIAQNSARAPAAEPVFAG